MVAENDVDNHKAARKKWNYIFIESLKMALLLPAMILFIEYLYMGIDHSLLDVVVLIRDYIFMFSVIFMIFVVYHYINWKKRRQNNV